MRNRARKAHLEPERWTEWEARSYFLEIAAREKPAIMEDVASKILPAFLTDRPGPEKMAAVDSWCDVHHLHASRDDWVRSTVVATLLRWIRIGGPAVLTWSTSPLIVSVPAAPPPRPWDPAQEAWEEYLEYLEAEYQPIALAAVGFRSAEKPGRPRKDDPAGLRAFEWLARYQVLGETLATVAARPTKRGTVMKGAGRDVSSIRQAIHRKADLIGLVLRHK